MARYDAWTTTLRAVAARGQESVEYSFDQLEALIGRALPASAAGRQWWANSSHVQALAWRAADFHVDQVYLDRRRVRFVRGVRGGTYSQSSATARAAVRPTSAVDVEPMGAPVDLRVRFQWLDAGPVTLDAADKPAFTTQSNAPGLYRLTLQGAGQSRASIYIGESDNLQRRLSGNYRNPGAGQQTSLRINGRLRDQLRSGGTVTLAVATTAAVDVDGREQPLDLARKTGRLLAENAALVLAHLTEDADILNL